MLACQIESNIVRCPDLESDEKMIAAFVAVRTKGNSVAGVITFIVWNSPRVFSHFTIDIICFQFLNSLLRNLYAGTVVHLFSINSRLHISFLCNVCHFLQQKAEFGSGSACREI